MCRIIDRLDGCFSLSLTPGVPCKLVTGTDGRTFIVIE
jgi:hypothetical protein